MTIILLSGKCFTGKDTIASHLHELKRVSIADTMKNEFMKVYPDINLFDRSIKEKYRTQLMEFTHQYPLFHWINLTRYVDACIVTDIRTYEEIKCIKGKFADVKVVRIEASKEARAKRGWKYNPEYDDTYLETQLDDYDFDLTVKNEVEDDIPLAVEDIRKLIKHDEYFRDLGYGFRRTIKPHNNTPFMNVIPLLATPKYRNMVLNNISRKILAANLDATHILGIESSGFSLGAWISMELGIGFAMARKPGKLPPPVTTIDYSMEYREKDMMEIQSDSFDENARVIVVDDIIATGGTMKGGVQLVQKLGATVVAIVAYTDLKMHKDVMYKHEYNFPMIVFAHIDGYFLYP